MRGRPIARDKSSGRGANLCHGRVAGHRAEFLLGTTWTSPHQGTIGDDAPSSMTQRAHSERLPINVRQRGKEVEKKSVRVPSNLGAMPMSRSSRVPSYRLCWGHGLAIVTIDGRNHELGPFGSRGRTRWRRMPAKRRRVGRASAFRFWPAVLTVSPGKFSIITRPCPPFRDPACGSPVYSNLF
jgi:hypothetical protein